MIKQSNLNHSSLDWSFSKKIVFLKSSDFSKIIQLFPEKTVFVLLSILSFFREVSVTSDKLKETVDLC